METKATYLGLNEIQVGLAALLIVINGAISIALRLRMERMLLIASLRTILQLVLIGFVLKWIFYLDRWYLVVAVAVLMTLIAGHAAASRVTRRYPGMLVNTVVSVWISSWLISALALAAILPGLDHWYQPQYAIPLLGMILGNTLNGISLGLTTLTESCITGRGDIETRLALGATRWEAARPVVRQALRTGMTPIINSMMVVGLVSLPGMMTGQLLAGVAPLEAIKYQIAIMFLIASATGLGTIAAVLLTYRKLFNADHQFLPRLIRDR